MAAMSWADRLARIPIAEQELIEALARAIYSTHWKPPAPEWAMASDNVKEWVRAQARSAILTFRAIERPS
jgi:hypothetical protein